MGIIQRFNTFPRTSRQYILPAYFVNSLICASIMLIVGLATATSTVDIREAFSTAAGVFFLAPVIEVVFAVLGGSLWIGILVLSPAIVTFCLLVIHRHYVRKSYSKRVMTVRKEMETLIDQTETLIQSKIERFTSELDIIMKHKGEDQYQQLNNFVRSIERYETKVSSGGSVFNVEKNGSIHKLLMPDRGYNEYCESIVKNLLQEYQSLLSGRITRFDKPIERLWQAAMIEIFNIEEHRDIERIKDLLRNERNGSKFSPQRISEVIGSNPEDTMKKLQIISDTDSSIGHYYPLEQVFIKDEVTVPHQEPAADSSKPHVLTSLQYCPSCKDSQSLQVRKCQKCGTNLPFCEICKRGYISSERRISCPHCSTIFHYNHFYATIQSQGICPTCRQEVQLGNL